MKFYNTNVTQWSKKRGEYEEPTQTPDEITTFNFYGRIETRKNPLLLFAIGGRLKNNFSDNWDIYTDQKGTLYSIPRKCAGSCQGTYFGDVHHIKNLMRKGYFRDTLTPRGFEMMKGV